jgi:simple sugar transport system substrate-binding protein
VSFQSTSWNTRGRATLVMFAVAAMLFVSACGNTDTSPAPAASGAAPSEAAAPSEGATAAPAASEAAATQAPPSGGGAKIVVIGGAPSDAFWAIVKRGAEDAGQVVAAQGGEMVWLGMQNYDNFAPDAADLVRTALSLDPDAVVGPDWVPEAMDEPFKAISDAGIPLIIYNAGGLEAADRVGAMNYIGSDEVVAGVAGGEYFGTHGAKNVLCINTLPGTANIEARCKGVTDGMVKQGGTASQLPLPSTTFNNATAIAEAIKGALLQDPTIDGVITISAADANSAANAISQAGAVGKVQLGTFDMDENNLQRIKDGTQLFAIDQQPYMQSYLSVSLLNGFVNYGLDIPTSPILTGPGIVDASNVDATIAGVEAGAR